MRKNLVSPNFKYPEIKATDYRFGSGQLIGTPLREDGDWRDYVPNEEFQKINGIESSSCYVQAQQSAIATILEEQFDLPNQNYSARFNFINSGGTPFGGSPIDGADSIRKDGLIPDEMLPFSLDVTSWEKFNSFFDNNEIDCVKAGQKYLREWSPRYDIVFLREETLENKYSKLREALKYSPVCASVYAWVEDNGVYIKPKGVSDNHLVEIVYLDENNQAYVWDSYSPFMKKLSANYNFDFAMRWSMEKKDPTQQLNWLEHIIKELAKFIKDILWQK